MTEGDPMFVDLLNHLMQEVTHACPPSGVGIMPCCGKTPFEVPRTDRITLDEGLVTCEGKKENQ